MGLGVEGLAVSTCPTHRLRTILGMVEGHFFGGGVLLV